MKVAKVGGVTIALGGLILLGGVTQVIGEVGVAPSERHGNEMFYLGGGIAIVGLVLGGAAAIGMEIHPEGEPEPATEQPDDLADRLVESAKDAARLGDCERVRRAGQQIHVMKARTHVKAFDDDPTLAPCLITAVPAPVVPESATGPILMDPITASP